MQKRWIKPCGLKVICFRIKKVRKGKKIKINSSNSFKSSRRKQTNFCQKKFSFWRGDDDKQEVRDKKIPQQKLNFSVYIFWL